MRTHEEIALEIGRLTKSVTEIKCVKGVNNPGLYFGAMLALKQQEKEYTICHLTKLLLQKITNKIPRFTSKR